MLGILLIVGSVFGVAIIINIGIICLERKRVRRKMIADMVRSLPMAIVEIFFMGISMLLYLIAGAVVIGLIILLIKAIF